MHDPLAPLLDDGVVEEVCARLKSGKEADLWLVRHAGEIVAAKVYKARDARNFKNNAGYLEGRQVRDTRMQRAMTRGSRFGQAAAEDAWKTKESDALHQLHAAGVRVPRPVMFYEGVLLMEVVVDSNGHPAPRLVDAGVGAEQAFALYADLRSQVVAMLCRDLIHGDLSPYNVLLGRDGPVVIDFPQVVGAAHNSQAERYFTRDLENIRRFFASIDPALDAASGDAREIWRAYVRRELTPDFVPSGRAEPRRGEGQPGQGQGHRHPQGPRHQQGQGHPQGQGHQQGQGHPRREHRGQGDHPRRAQAEPRGPGGGQQGPPRGPPDRRPDRGAPGAPGPRGQEQRRQEGRGPRGPEDRRPDRRGPLGGGNRRPPSSGPEVIRVVRPLLQGGNPTSGPAQGSGQTGPGNAPRGPGNAPRGPGGSPGGHHRRRR